MLGHVFKYEIVPDFEFWNILFLQINSNNLLLTRVRVKAEGGGGVWGEGVEGGATPLYHHGGGIFE